MREKALQSGSHFILQKSLDFTFFRKCWWLRYCDWKSKSLNVDWLNWMLWTWMASGSNKTCRLPHYSWNNSLVAGKVRSIFPEMDQSIILLARVIWQPFLWGYVKSLHDLQAKIECVVADMWKNASLLKKTPLFICFEPCGNGFYTSLLKCDL